MHDAHIPHEVPLHGSIVFGCVRRDHAQRAGLPAGWQPGYPLPAHLPGAVVQLATLGRPWPRGVICAVKNK